METIEEFLTRQEALLIENQLVEVAANLKAYCYEIDKNVTLQTSIDDIIRQLESVEKSDRVINIRRSQIKELLSGLINDVRSSRDGEDEISTEKTSVRKTKQAVLDYFTARRGNDVIEVSATPVNFRLFLILLFVIAIIAMGGYVMLQAKSNPSRSSEQPYQDEDSISSLVECDCNEVSSLITSYNNKLNDYENEIRELERSIIETESIKTDSDIENNDRIRTQQIVPLQSSVQEIKSIILIELDDILSKCEVQSCDERLKELR